MTQPFIEVSRVPGHGRLLWTPDEGEGLLPGQLLFATSLEAVVRRRGRITDILDLGSGLVTNAGVNAMADDFVDGSFDITTFNQHAWGTGTTAAAVGDTALQTQQGSRVAGTKTNPTANVFRTTATITAGGTLSITEWGLLSATTGGVLWDRRVFTAQGLNANDSITFTYDLTINAGG